MSDTLPRNMYVTAARNSSKYQHNNINIANNVNNKYNNGHIIIFHCLYLDNLVYTMHITCTKHLYTNIIRNVVSLCLFFFGFKPLNCRLDVPEFGVTRLPHQSASMTRAARTPLLRMRGVAIGQLPLSFKALS